LRADHLRHCLLLAALPACCREVTVVEGRAGEDWMVYRDNTRGSSSSDTTSSSSTSESRSSSGPVLAHLHDAASSWWTQTAASSQLQLEVARAVAAAAGRYMHVMWPQVRPQQQRQQPHIANFYQSTAVQAV
jgi:hypothetical protein